MKYRIVEKFVSVNGEGLKSGALATFVRFFGCNLRCDYCDSRYSYDPNEECEEMTADEIVGYIKDCGVENVTLTGGEPIIQEGIGELIDMIVKAGFNVEIETNGAVDIAPFADIRDVADAARSGSLSFTLDYKTGCSGMTRHMIRENWDVLTKRDCIKFVVGSSEDLDEMREIVTANQLTQRTNILVSACFGRITLEEIAGYLKRYTMNGVRMQVQLHKVIWNPDDRGV